MNVSLEGIKELEAVALESQRQCQEALKIIQARDRQIAAAIDALVSIGTNTCCDSCREAALVAGRALDEMRRIHKEIDSPI